jgi:tRNA A37 threonylcarbamoyladenosine dehydratase
MQRHPEAFQRNDILLSAAEIHALQNRHILIAGLGGVGGFVAESLCRAGIERFTLLDHDTVSASNLNRQIIALHSTLGQPKTAVLAARMRDINPAVILDERPEFLHKTEAQDFIRGTDFDFVADCIDSIASKAALVAACHQAGVPVVSSLGAGNRIDVTKVRVTKLNQTEGCGLARELRATLRKMQVAVNYPVVFSNERARKPLPHQPVDGPMPGRPRAVNGTISYMPAVFGLFVSGVIIKHFLAEVEHE